MTTGHRISTLLDLTKLRSNESEWSAIMWTGELLQVMLGGPPCHDSGLS